jgi:uncharacterized protein (TIGR03437 family)
VNRLAAAAPQIFPVTLNRDGTANSAAHPAALGSIMSPWATGLGNTSSAAATGEIFPLESRPLAANITLPIVPVGNLELLYAGASPGLISGLNQLNFRLPAVYTQTPLSARQTIRITVSIRSAAIFSSAGFVIHFRPPTN